MVFSTFTKSMALTAMLVMSLALVGCPSKDVVVVDDQTDIVVDSVDTSQIIFEYQGDPSTPLEVGDIVAGTDGGGYLRRINAVTQEGDIVTADTEQVSLAEAVDVGTLDADVQFTAKDFARAGLRTAGANRTAVDLGGITLYNKDGLSVTITRGSIDFAPHVSLDASFNDHKLEYFKAVTTGDLTVDMDVRVQATKPITLSYETNLFPAITQPFVFNIGPIPVTGTASLKFPVGIVGTVTGTASIESGFDSTSTIALGGELAGGQWNDLSSFSGFNPNGHDVVWSVSTGVGIDVFMKAQAGLNLYGVSDLWGTVVPYVAADAQIIPAPMSVLVTAGIDGIIDYKLGIFDINLVNKSWYFPGPSWVLYSWTQPTIN